jgi:molybdopterin-guanine dinucleotide biosynthesis protein
MKLIVAPLATRLPNLVIPSRSTVKGGIDSSKISSAGTSFDVVSSRNMYYFFTKKNSAEAAEALSKMTER